MAKQVVELDISVHRLVPRHEVLGKEEAERVLEELGVSPEDLPKIYSDDPAIRKYDVSQGDIIRIVRESPTAGRFIAYRYVIER